MNLAAERLRVWLLQAFLSSGVVAAVSKLQNYTTRVPGSWVGPRDPIQAPTWRDVEEHKSFDWRTPPDTVVPLGLGAYSQPS